MTGNTRRGFAACHQEWICQATGSLALIALRRSLKVVDRAKNRVLLALKKNISKTFSNRSENRASFQGRLSGTIADVCPRRAPFRLRFCVSTRQVNLPMAVVIHDGELHRTVSLFDHRGIRESTTVVYVHASDAWRVVAGAWRYRADEIRRRA